MEIEFRNKEVLELHRKGRSGKYPFGHTVIEKFFLRIEILQAATTIHDLWKSPSLHFEKMQGHDNRYSIRIDRKYRLEFDIEWTDAKKSTGKVIIIGISKHYE